MIELASAWNPASTVRGFLRPGGRGANTRPRSETTSKILEPSSLAFRTGREEDEMMMSTVSSSATLPLPVQRIPDMPRKWDLPRHSSRSEEDLEREKFLWDTELVVGRVAMIAALTLMIGEVTTGDSILHQITSFLPST